MANGREAAVRVQPSDAPEPRKRIRAVLLDAHGVMFEPIDCSRTDLQKRVLEQVIGVTVDVDARELARRVRLARLEAIARFPLAELGSEKSWSWINTKAFSDLGVTEERGAEISRRLSKPELYHMPKKTRRVLRWLFERKFPFKSTDGSFIATASNADAHIVEALVHQSGIRDHFRHYFTADRLGGIYKPSPEYFLALIAQANEAQAVLGKPPLMPDEFLFIGNSVTNDAPAARPEVGMNVIILRDPNETLTTTEVSEYLGATERDVLWVDDWADAKRNIDLRFRRPKPEGQ